MARADLLLNLVKSGAQGDQVQFQRTVEALAADERRKNHNILADRLLAQLRSNGNRNHFLNPSPSVKSIDSPLLAEVIPERRLEDLILPVEVTDVILDLVEEQHRSDLLRSHNIEPRNRILLAGPPGNGKTSLAEAIADALHIPILIVRYEAVIGSYLGETAQRISQVFEHARSRQCVLFFDEFDTIGKERGDPQETGEIKRVVSSLLLHIDSLPSYVIIVTASNHPELLDRAVWRRFQIRLELPMPKQNQIECWFEKFEDNTDYQFGLSHRTLARSLKGLSFAEIEDFGHDVIRRIVLDQPTSNARKITRKYLRLWKKRYSVKLTETQEEIQ